MQLLTVGQVAARLAVHEDTVRRLIERGRLPAKRVGRAVRVDERDLDAFVNLDAAGARPRPAEMITPGQLRALHAKLDTLAALQGVNDAAERRARARIEKARYLAAAAKEFGRPIVSSRELTADEANWVLDLLESAAEAALAE